MSLIEDARDTHIAVTFVGDDYETCLVCSQPAPCLAIRLADELADMERSRAAVVAKCAVDIRHSLELRAIEGPAI